MNSFKLLGLIALSVLCCFCAPVSYEIQSECQFTSIHNYRVKWDVSPLTNGKVEIFSSKTPDCMNAEKSIGTFDACQGVTNVVSMGNSFPQYFLLKFDNGITSIAGLRCIDIEGTQNFRDIGGYFTSDGKMIKWGKIYRSGDFDELSPYGVQTLRSLNINTVLDLRMPSEIESDLHNEDCFVNYIHNPINTFQTDPLPRIHKKEFFHGDAVIFMQDVFCGMALKSTAEIKTIFDHLIDETKYPLAYACRFGTVQSSLVTALILSALEVSESTIIYDYLLNNQYFSIKWLAPIANHLPEESQDAIVTMFISEQKYIMSAFDAIQRKYGSIDNYLFIEMGVDQNYKQRLREIMLQ